MTIPGTGGSAPVREPAWPLPRAAHRLWMTQGVISTLVWGVLLGLALAFVPTDDGPLSALPWAGPALLAAYAVVAIVTNG